MTGLWGIFYYREIQGAMNIIGFLSSSCVVFSGILLMASEHGVKANPKQDELHVAS